MLLIHSDESVYPKMSEKQMGELMAAYGEYQEKIEKAGVYRDSARLRPTRTATTVRVRDGRTMTTDGPFAETKEQVGGYYLMLRRLGRSEEARAAYLRALDLAGNAAERRFLLRRLEEVSRIGADPPASGGSSETAAKSYGP